LKAPSASTPALRCQDLRFSYRTEAGVVPAVRGISFEAHRGEILAIQGPSGSGKSTLLYLLGLLLRPEAGSLEIEGREVSLLSDEERARLRNRELGFVFQQFHLLPRARVLDNLLLPASYASEQGEPTAEDIAQAQALAKRLGILEQLGKLPNQLSGGQQQRVAIGRALLNHPSLVLADEPTGNLDSQSAAEILSLLREIAREGRAVIIITHDREIARSCDRILFYRDGGFEREERLHTPETLRNGPEAPVRPNGDANRGLRGRIRRTLSLIARQLPMAAENLRRHRVRSILTMLGVTIGIASVLSMITLGTFVKDRIIESFQTLGVNKVMLYGWPNSELRAEDRFGLMFREFTWEQDIQPLPRIFPEIRLVAPMFSSFGDTADFGGREITNVRTIGSNADYFEISNRQLAAGSFLNPHQIDAVAPVCVIGSEIVKELFRDVPPVGQILHVALGSGVDYTCKVIGTLVSQSSNQDWQRADWQIVIPHTLYRFLAGVSSGSRGGMSVGIQLHPEFDTEAEGRKIQGYFETKYGNTGRFMVGSDATLISQMKRFLGLFAILLAGIAVVSLVVGGVGIANMMLVSVSERVREIGLRRAVGAPSRSIRAQFLIEASLLCWIAGVAGLAIGFLTYEALIKLASLAVDRLTFAWVVLPEAWLLSLLAIGLTGILSGLVPALKAEKLQVVEALRSE
jgi:macrolide transport system ATP-binding/permease protein